MHVPGSAEWARSRTARRWVANGASPGGARAIAVALHPFDRLRVARKDYRNPVRECSARLATELTDDPGEAVRRAQSALVMYSSATHLIGHEVSTQTIIETSGRYPGSAYHQRLWGETRGLASSSPECTPWLDDQSAGA